MFAWTSAVRLHAKLDEALVAAEQALKFARDEARTAMCLDTIGWIWNLKGDLEKAKTYLRQSVDLAEPDALKRHHLATVEAKAMAAAQV